MATQNRYPLVTRLNEKERYTLMALCQFWQMDEKQLVKFALGQLEKVTGEVSAKIQRDLDDERSANETIGGGDGAGVEHAEERREEEKAGGGAEEAK